jgi:putative heme iron utilization protein
MRVQAFGPGPIQCPAGSRNPVAAFAVQGTTSHPFRPQISLFNDFRHSQPATQRRHHVAAAFEIDPAADDSLSSSPKPSSAETARTIVDLVAHGTLCTAGDEGIPLGTYVSYVLDGEGQPILRLRADAVHTANLRADPRCSLFVQPGEHPARLVARVTLIGRIEPVSEEVAASAADLHNTLHAGGVGVDAPQSTDLYFRLLVDRCFYVGGLSGESAAEVISGDAYRSAEADPLRTCAASLAQHMNSARLEDVMRIGCKVLKAPFENMHYAELLWVDRLGAYIKAVGQDGGSTTFRVPFLRAVEDEREVRSALTMMAQVAWEEERPGYAPQPMMSAASGAPES